MAFVGYELESGEVLPYFNALSSKLDAIQQEVLDARAHIENDVEGKILRDSALRFDRGTDTGTAWDKAVNAFERDRQATRMFIGDKHGHGKEIDLIKKYAEIKAKENKLLRRSEASGSAEQQNTTWDHAVDTIRKNPGKQGLFKVNENGHGEEILLKQEKAPAPDKPPAGDKASSSPKSGPGLAMGVTAALALGAGAVAFMGKKPEGETDKKAAASGLSFRKVLGVTLAIAGVALGVAAARGNGGTWA